MIGEVSLPSVSSDGTPDMDSVPIRATVTAARNRSFAWYRRIEKAIAADLDGVADEHLVWLVSFVTAMASFRPLDPLDPWSVLLHSMVPGRERPGAPLPPLIDFQWHTKGPGAMITKIGGERYKITMRNDAAGWIERRRVLAHELAHIDLDNFGYGPLRPPDHSEELRTDERAAELFTLDDLPAARGGLAHHGLPRTTAAKSPRLRKAAAA